jgi:chemotaxis protein MotB
VLSNNPDISVLVEGHTDSDKLYGGTEVVDNWDLSVMRATAVAKALENAGVEPGQITASGRGEYFPVASNDTPEGKAKNRRIEIILEPDVSELMKLLNSM